MIRNFIERRFFKRIPSFDAVRLPLIRGFEVPDAVKFPWRAEAQCKGLFGSNLLHSREIFLNPVSGPRSEQFLIQDAYSYKTGMPQTDVNFFYEWLQLEQATAIKALRKDRKWGVEIGVRYFPVKQLEFYYSKLRDFESFDAWTVSATNKMPRNTPLRWNMMIAVVLAGGPKEYLKNKSSIYKYWTHGSISEVHMLENVKLEQELVRFWESADRIYIEMLVRDWMAFLIQSKRSRFRWAIWDHLSYLKARKSAGMLARFGFFSFVYSLLLDFYSGYFRKK